MAKPATILVENKIRRKYQGNKIPWVNDELKY
jgi:hypothetical protein